MIMALGAASDNEPEAPLGGKLFTGEPPLILLDIRLRNLQSRNIDAKARRPPVGHAAFGDQNPTPIRQAVFAWTRRFPLLPQPLLQPFLLAADRLGVISSF